MKLLKLFQSSDEELLRSVKVASPCHESWEGMSGGDTVRSCDRCQKKVYNLSEMTAAEAAALVREAEGRVCVRFYRRADGTMLTTDCPVGASAARAKKVKVAAAWSGAAAAAAGIAVATSRPPQPTMGSAATPLQATTGVALVFDEPSPAKSVKDDFEKQIPVPEHEVVMGNMPAPDKSFLAQHADQIEIAPRDDPFQSHDKVKQPVVVGKRRTAK